MPGPRWDGVLHPRAAAWALLVPAGLLLLPGGAAQAYDDPGGDADGVLEIIRATVTFGNGTIGIQVRFDPGEVPENRAVRGVVLLGTPGEAEPAEWYQFTIANQTTVHVAHGGAPRLAELKATSWTGDLASAEWHRDSPAAAPCSFAVVEAGTMDSNGFVRSDVAPPGFASPEEAWPVDGCPDELIIEGERPHDEEKGSPGLPLVAVIASLALVLAIRRRSP